MEPLSLHLGQDLKNQILCGYSNSWSPITIVLKGRIPFQHRNIQRHTPLRQKWSLTFSPCPLILAHLLSLTQFSKPGVLNLLPASHLYSLSSFCAALQPACFFCHLQGILPQLHSICRQLRGGGSPDRLGTASPSPPKLFLIKYLSTQSSKISRVTIPPVLILCKKTTWGR